MASRMAGPDRMPNIKLSCCTLGMISSKQVYWHTGLSADEVSIQQFLSSSASSTQARNSADTRSPESLTAAISC
jgi:hypothetical protein